MGILLTLLAGRDTEIILPPALVVKLRAWYDKDSLVMTGSTITGWNDKTANALHFTQVTASLQPVYNAVEESAVFQGVGIRLSRTGALIAANTSHTILYVAKRLATNGTFNDTVIEQGNDGANWSARLTSGGVENSINHKVTTNLGGSDGVTATSQPINTYLVGNHSWNQATNTTLIRRNGIQIGSFSRTGQILGNGTVSNIGSRSAAQTNIVIKEILLFNNVLSTEERTQAERYLSTRHGVALL